ncbi:MAG TPA: cation:proton antiporter, partial [Candidatus Limnocylindrales bacterium]|nr:cation:proton antiporter [Candidatus Limnocylindrales bacterium]
LHWFRHNPMVLVQSIVEATLTYVGVFWLLHWLDVPDPVANPVALMAIVASPAVLMRVVIDTRASGPVTERALTLATLNTFYGLALGSAQAGLLESAPSTLTEKLAPVLVVLGLSFVVGALMALALRSALRVMSSSSENTSILLLAIIAAGAALTAHIGGSAPLAALLGGVLLRQLTPKPWAWPQRLGTAASLITMMMFVLVSIVAAQADWSYPVASVVLGLIGVRALAKIAGVALANPGSGASWKQAFWLGCAMAPLSSIALLMTSTFVTASPLLGHMITQIALPAILLMELFGAMLATVAIYGARENSRPWTPEAFGGVEETQR